MINIILMVVFVIFLFISIAMVSALSYLINMEGQQLNHHNDLEDNSYYHSNYLSDTKN